jgi:hypothetical protein
MTINLIGWVATALSASSYLFRQPVALRKTQALAAFPWIIYGLSVGAIPVVVANVIVAGAALYSTFTLAPSTARRGPA